MSRVVAATYLLELAWGKQAGVADVAPLWTTQNWLTGANAGYAAYVHVNSLTGLKVGDTGWDCTKPLTVTRGKNARLTDVQEGAMTCPLRDPTGMFAPLNGSSPLAGKLVPNIGIRLSAVDPADSSWNVIFMGWTKRFTRTPDRQGHGQIDAVDLMHRLARHENAGILSGVITNTGSALTAIIGKLPWAYTSFANGITVDSSTGLQNNFGFADSLLSVIQGVVSPSLGTFYIAKDGTAVFIGRGNSNASVGTVTNVMTAVPSEVDEDLIYNEAIATMTRPGQSNFQPSQQKVADGTSVNQYGKSTWTMSSPWWAGNADALAAANYILSKYKTPVNRVRTITIRNRDAATLSIQLKVDVGNQITVAEARDGTSATYVVYGVSHSIQPPVHETTLTLAPSGY